MEICAETEETPCPIILAMLMAMALVDIHASIKVAETIRTSDSV
jgi:hypothetical protein